jgi:hypothetical protein
MQRFLSWNHAYQIEIRKSTSKSRGGDDTGSLKVKGGFMACGY